jgi:hypothetical protein
MPHRKRDQIAARSAPDFEHASRGHIRRIHSEEVSDCRYASWRCLRERM